MPEATPQAEIHAEIKPEPTPELVSLRSPDFPIEIIIRMAQIVREHTHPLGHLDPMLDAYLIQRYPNYDWLWRVSGHSTTLARIGTDEAKRLWTHTPGGSRFFLVNLEAGIHEVVGIELAQSILWPDMAAHILRGRWTASEGWTTKENDDA